MQKLFHVLGVILVSGLFAKAATATPAETIKVPEGFKIELLRSATREEGSWICMTVDDKGRLIVSPQDDKQPLLRFTVDPKGGIQKIEPINLPVRTAMGLLYAFDTLYVSGNGPQGTAIYKLTDTDKDDQFDRVDLFKKVPGGTGEHGAHALVLGLDQMIYIIHGNSTPLIDGVDPQSAYQNYREDDLLPRVKDPMATFFDSLKVPYGYLLRTDRNGSKWELINGGMRNVYDIDFNPDGELFAFDSDMEWEWGSGWYRPTRVLHMVSGADYGFREGTAKWPTYYADSTPAAVDIGIGSPTGVKFGTKAAFPEKYRRAFYIADWTYGRIISVYLHPQGSTYKGNFETFVQGKPLNVSDIEIGQDGAMYFITGGRGTQAGLYRVSYKDEVPTAEIAGSKSNERELRKSLEAFHGKKDPTAVDLAWPQLGRRDDFIRYAARVAIESQPVAEWSARALEEKNPDRALMALLALARVGEKSHQTNLFERLLNFEWNSLAERQKLELLRVYQVSLARHGQPSPELFDRAQKSLEAAYPAKSEALNHELCQLLVYLKSPEVITKTLALMQQAKTQEEQTKYALYLRVIPTGWSLDQRRTYFSWFKSLRPSKMGPGSYPGGQGHYVWTNAAAAAQRHPAHVVQWFKDVDREYGDGASFFKFIDKIRDEAAATLTADERRELAPLLRPDPVLVKAKPSREFKHVQEWEMSDFPQVGNEKLRGRNFNNGRDAFLAAQCLACHKFGNEGGSVGPDLSAVSSRYGNRELLEAILEPSKVVSEQYQALTFVIGDDEEVAGLVVEDSTDKYSVLVDALEDIRMEVPKNRIKSRHASKVSPMPEGLANVLTKEDMLDLLAYLESNGRRNHAVFSNR